MGVCSDQNKCITYTISSIVIYAAAITMVVVGSLNLGYGDQENGCPSARGMPMFNIIGGSIIMAGLFVREILKRFCECCNSCCDEEKCCRIGGKLLKCGFTLVYDICFMIITAVWLIAGTASVIETYSKILGEHLTSELLLFIALVLGHPDVQQGLAWAFGTLKETSDSLANYVNIQAVNDQLEEQTPTKLMQDGKVDCDEILYNLTLVVLIAGWIIIALATVYLIVCKVFYQVLCCKPCKDDQERDVYRHPA